MMTDHAPGGYAEGVPGKPLVLRTGDEIGSAGQSPEMEICAALETPSVGGGVMRAGRLGAGSEHLAAVRLGVTLVALLVLAAGVLLVLVMGDRTRALIATLAATLVGWTVTLILAKLWAESPTSTINSDDDTSRS
jgi:hypothetical protein